MYEQNKGKKIVEQLEYEESYKEDVANFDLLEWLYGVDREVK